MNEEQYRAQREALRVAMENIRARNLPSMIADPLLRDINQKVLDLDAAWTAEKGRQAGGGGINASQDSGDLSKITSVGAYNTAQDFLSRERGFQDRNAPTASTFDVNRQGLSIETGPEGRQAQINQLKFLQDQAEGRGISLARMDAARNASMVGRNALALARTGRGNLGAAMGQAQRAGGQAMMSAAAEGSRGAIAERLNAQGALTSAAGALRGQDITLGTSQANIFKDTNLADAAARNETARSNAELDLNSRIADDERRRVLASLGLDSQGQAISGLTSTYSTSTGGEGKPSTMERIIGTTAPTLTALATRGSDIRAKENIETTDVADLDALVKSFEAFDYEYIDKANGEGIHTGPMAQAIESSKLGERMIIEKDGIKHVDIGRLVLALAAVVGHLGRKVDALASK